MSLPLQESFTAITAILERFEDRFAVLRNEALGEFRWPITNLPQDLQVGQSVTLKAVNPKSENDEKLDRMRTLLEELIN